MANPLLNEKSINAAAGRDESQAGWGAPSGSAGTWAPPINDGPVSTWHGGLATVRGTASATLTLLLLLIAFPRLMAQTSLPDTLPAKMVWLNSDFNPNMESLKQKVTIIMVSDPHCVECSYYATLIQEKILAISAFQFMEIYKADTTAPISRAHLVNFIQQQAITHPIGVLGDLRGFHSITEERCPYFLLYELSDVPSMSGFGPDGFNRLIRRMDELIAEKTTLDQSMLFQFKTWMEPRWWANPVVETPSYMAVNEDDGVLYLNDAAHHRILSFESNGQVRAMLGSMLPGYVDESMYSARFFHPHGMEYYKNALYVADTYNHRLRKIDFETEQLSVENTQENVQRNGCSYIEAICGDVGVLEGRKFELILANINKNKISKIHLKKKYLNLIFFPY